jgi:small subunit ribosomal protein S16
VSVKIRLMRVGKKKQPSYRVVVADGRSPRDGRYIEIVGQYQPRLEPSGFTVDGDKVISWLQKGAQPTEQVHKLLVSAGIWETYESARTKQSTAARDAARKAKGRAAALTEKAEAKAKADAEAKAAADAEAKAKAKAEAEAAQAAEAAEAEASTEDAPAEDAAADESAE